MVQFVGELCINHQGNFKLAKKIIKKFSFLNVIKVQKANPLKFLGKKKYNGPHPNPKNAFGKTYGEHKEHLEFTIEQHRELRDLIRSQGQRFAVSVYDIESAQQMAGLEPHYVKIPSCLSNDFKLIKFCEDNFRSVHISTGMTNKGERENIHKFCSASILYSCTSNYTNLGNVYIERYPGFSCHVPDIAYAQFAIMQGAQWVEYHITLNRDWKGTDQSISLLPNEYNNLIDWYNRKIDAIQRIKLIRPDDVPGEELEARAKLWKT